MLFLWCVLAALCIGICFKLFPRWHVNTFNAIVINYTTCLLLGLLLDRNISLSDLVHITHQPWFKFDIILGLLFIIGFNLTAYAIRHFGLTLSVLMQRMSLILTVSFTVIIFKEKFGWVELFGLILALAAILVINKKPAITNSKSSLFQALILFLVLLFSALIEITLYYVEKTKVVGHHQMIFTTLGFGTAAMIGWVIILWSLIRLKSKVAWRDLYAGLLLGLPNYFSVYLILMMLNHGWKGSVMYPMLNVSVLLFSTLVAVFVFKESLNRINQVGIILAIFAILIIAYAQNRTSWEISF